MTLSLTMHFQLGADGLAIIIADHGSLSVILKISSCQIEQSIKSYDLFRKSAFQIGLASLLNALELKCHKESIAKLESVISRFPTNFAESSFFGLRQELSRAIPAEMAPKRPNPEVSTEEPRSPRSVVGKVKSISSRFRGKRYAIAHTR